MALRKGPRALARKALRALPDALFLRLVFLLFMRRILHLRKPRTYSEALQWIKVHGALERYAPYADKYGVRDYVARMIGPQYLVPLIGVWDEFDQIPWEDLPEQFVLKSTHGCSYNFVCRDKSSTDVASLRQTVTSWMSQNFYDENRESQYRYIVPRLIAEAYLEDDSGGFAITSLPALTACRSWWKSCAIAITKTMRLTSMTASGTFCQTIRRAV